MRSPIQVPTDVAIFLPGLDGGGTEKMFLTLAMGFIEAGLKVDFVLVRAQGVYISRIPANARVIDLKAKRMAASFPGLVRYLRTYKPTTLLSALGLSDLIAVLSKLAVGSKTRVIVSVRGMAYRLERITLRKRIENSLIFLSYRWADGIVAVTHAVAEDTCKQSGIPIGKIEVIYNPVVVPDLENQMNEPLDHPFFLPDQPPVILGVGRLVRDKDFATLLRAFAIVRQSTPGRLLILGEGEERSRLESLARELGVSAEVSMPGFVNNPYKYMKKATVFVLSSISEGIGNVLIEAMACGCPVVSTDCKGGAREILGDGKYGFLTPVMDAESMARAISGILAGQRKNIDPEWLHQFDAKKVQQRYLSMMGFST